MFNLFWKNQSYKFLAFIAPVFIALIITALMRDNISYGNIIASFSIILMLNVTALFQISKGVLVKLFKQNNENGDSYYKILKNKYETVIYVSFVYISFLLALDFISISTDVVLYIVNFCVLYLLFALIIQNILLVRYYFAALDAELKKLKTPDSTL